jgi:hypothetical protein
MADENLQHLPAIGGDGVPDVEETTQDTDLDHETASDETPGVPDGEEADQTTQKDPSKTREELEEERRRAVSELFKIKNKEKQARAQLDEEFNDLLDLAREDVSVIDRIHARNPEKADRLTQALFNMTYDDALAKAQTANSPQDTPSDIDAIVAQKVAEALGQRDASAAEQTVQKELDSLLASTGYAPTSTKFQRLMKEIQEIGIPQNVKQARAFFKLAQDNMRGSADQDAVDMQSAVSMSSGGMKTQNRMPMPSQAYFEAARLNGRTKEQALDAWKKLQEQKSKGLSL